MADGRNPAWEGAFYKNLTEAVATRSGLDAGPLLALTVRRMGPSLGAAQYGDASFLTDGRDLLRECSEELADSIAYIVMEMQRLNATGEDRSSELLCLFEAAVYACIADARLREARAAARAR